MNKSKAFGGSVSRLNATGRSLFGSTSTLESTIMDPSGPTGGKDANMMHTYLKIAVSFINDSKDFIDLKLGRPVKLEDLNNLSSENMLKIVAFLLREVIGDKEISRNVPLTTFNQFGSGEVTYDCAIDTIYHATRQIFPEDDKLFHYSVLLLPAKNPKRTRTVIAYIIEFVLMCDELRPRFQDCFDQVMAENSEKVEICGQIDELKESITEEIQKLHTENERLPMLQQEMEVVEENIRKQQGVFSNLKANLDRLKVKYDEEEMRLKTLNQELENLNKAGVELEAMIVANPKEMEIENLETKKKFEEETKRRERYGVELEKLRKSCESYETLKGQVNDAIQNFQNLVALMEQTKNKIETFTKSGNDVSQMMRKVEQLRKECSQLSESCVSKRQNLDDKAKKHEEDVTKLRSEAQVNVKLKQDVVTAQIVQAKKDIDSLKEEINSLQKECSRLEQEIYDVTYAIRIGIPQQRKAVENQCKATITKNQEQFSVFPVLDREPLPKPGETPSPTNNASDDNERKPDGNGKTG